MYSFSRFQDYTGRMKIMRTEKIDNKKAGMQGENQMVILYDNCLHLYSNCHHPYNNCHHLYGNCHHPYSNCLHLYDNCLHLYDKCLHLYDKGQGSNLSVKSYN